jgi:hypothetical protein
MSYIPWEVVYIRNLNAFKMSSNHQHTRIWVLYRLSGCERSKTELQKGALARSWKAILELL